MNNAIGDTLARDWNAIRHPGQHANPQDQPQEAHMTTTKLSAAREAISAIADNPLIDAIAEAGIGRWMNPVEIANLVGLWREVEYGRIQAHEAAKSTEQAEAQQQAAQQTSAQQLKPQQA